MKSGRSRRRLLIVGHAGMKVAGGDLHVAQVFPGIRLRKRFSNTRHEEAPSLPGYEARDRRQSLNKGSTCAARIKGIPALAAVYLTTRSSILNSAIKLL